MRVSLTHPNCCACFTRPGSSDWSPRRRRRQGKGAKAGRKSRVEQAHVRRVVRRKGVRLCEKTERVLVRRVVRRATVVIPQERNECGGQGTRPTGERGPGPECRSVAALRTTECAEDDKVR